MLMLLIWRNRSLVLLAMASVLQHMDGREISGHDNITVEIYFQRSLGISATDYPALCSCLSIIICAERVRACRRSLLNAM